MSKRPKDNTVGPWAETKLEALRRGLEYYTTRLKHQPWQTLYVDAFAGPGLSQVRSAPAEKLVSNYIGDLFSPQPSELDPVEEEIRYLKGSPRVALEIKNPFNRYIFIERDRGRLSELSSMAREFRDTRVIDIRSGDANDELLAILRGGFSRQSHRAYVFLDPFGVQVPWATIEALAATKAIEIMVNFPLGMAIRRMLPRHGGVPAGWGISLDTFFGSPDWREQAYGFDVDFFGEAIKLQDSETRLLEWYRARLEQIFGFVSPARLITNTRGGHLYYLVWAGPHHAGAKGADYIMRMRSLGRTKKKP